ncbi:MAG: hypothetical protein RIS47_1811 [Bacteroidota bacterium]|jgi:hypothetical protein
MEAIQTSQQTFRQEVFAEAEAYCQHSLNAFAKKKFNYETIYNIICMSAEKYMVALVLHHNIMPQHHTLLGLIKEVVSVTERKDLVLLKHIRFLNSFQNLCSLEIMKNPEITTTDMQQLCDGLSYLRQFVSNDIQK